MPSSELTTFRSQKIRLTDAREPSRRTTLMCSSFLAMDWPLRATYLIVNQHQAIRPASVMIPPAMSTGLLPPSSASALHTEPDGHEQRQVHHPAEDDAVEDGRAETRAGARALGERIGADNIRDDRTWRRVQIRRGHEGS